MIGSGVGSGSGDIFFCIADQHPLHIGGEIPQMIVNGQACLGPLAEPGVENYAE